MKKVLVLFGGVSSEYEVSCVSAYNVINHIPHDKYEVYAIGITKDGEWFLFDGDAALLPDDKWLECGNCKKAVISPDRNDHGIIIFDDEKIKKIHIDACFPVLHGKNGEDGTMQGLLEISGIPYIGCNTLSAAVCMDKEFTNTLADAAGIKQAKWLHTNEYSYAKASEEFVKKAVDYLGFPIFVKPANAGSSVGISKAVDEAGLKNGIKNAFQYDKKVVLEEFIDGFEVECAVIGNREPMASAVGQILPCNDFYDYDAKYISDSKLLIPADLTLEKQNEVRAVAVAAYTALNCTGLSRVDFFVDRKNGDVIFNEINTMPGFTQISMYPKLMEQSGVPYPKLLDKLFKLAIERSENK